MYETQIHQKASAAPEESAEATAEQAGKLILVLHEQWIHRSQSNLLCSFLNGK